MKVLSVGSLSVLLTAVIVTGTSVNAFATTRSHNAVVSCPPTQTVGTGIGFDQEQSTASNNGTRPAQETP